MSGKKYKIHLVDMRFNGIFGRHSYCGGYYGPSHMVETVEELGDRDPCQKCVTRKTIADTRYVTFMERVDVRDGV